jgi:predicted dienelactone hydrolase
MTANPRRRWLQAAAGLVLGMPLLGRSSEPVPLEATVDETWIDSARQRSVPVRLRWPAAPAPGADVPVVLYSHGLGGTRAGGERWGQAWAAAGLLVVHLQHPGSDFDAVRGGGFADRAALRRVAGPQQLLARLQDVGFALDELARRKAAGASRWARIRPQGVGLSGHSFGAHTTLGMAGQRYPGFDGVDEPRLAAFIALSPALPLVGDAKTALSRLTRPLLCITGTRDGDVVGNGATPERRIAVFDALPAGAKAQLVLHDADHMSFAGQTSTAVDITRRDPEARALQPVHHDAVARRSTDWWRAHLMGDSAAGERSKHPQGLAAHDHWQMG